VTPSRLRTVRACSILRSVQRAPMFKTAGQAAEGCHSSCRGRCDGAAGEDRGMLFSFLYLAVGALFGLLIRCRSGRTSRMNGTLKRRYFASSTSYDRASRNT
jgi:hypothetical protein